MTISDGRPVTVGDAIDLIRNPGRLTVGELVTFASSTQMGQTALESIRQTADQARARLQLRAQSLKTQVQDTIYDLPERLSAGQTSSASMNIKGTVPVLTSSSPYIGQSPTPATTPAQTQKAYVGAAHYESANSGPLMAWLSSRPRIFGDILSNASTTPAPAPEEVSRLGFGVKLGQTLPEIHGGTVSNTGQPMNATGLFATYKKPNTKAYAIKFG